MRIVFIGAGATTVTTAQYLIGRGHEVIIVEQDEARIQAVSEHLDCGFIHGDGTRPDILKEVDPAAADVLLCLTGMDQDNILASLVGRTLKIPRIITKLEDPEFETVATALDLQSVVVPVRTVSSRLADLIEGKDTLELSGLIKDEARLLSFIVQPHQAGPLQQLDLHEEARVIWLYRNGKLKFAIPDLELQAGDEVVVLTRNDSAAAVHDRLMASPPDAS